MEECQQGTLNTRINILHLLDTLCETSRNSPPGYTAHAARDLDTIVKLVVPDEKDGLLNFMHTQQVC